MAQTVRGSVHQIVDLTHVYTQTDHVPCVLQAGWDIIVLQVIPTLSFQKFTNISNVFNVIRKIKRRLQNKEVIRFFVFFFLILNKKLKNILS